MGRRYIKRIFELDEVIGKKIGKITIIKPLKEHYGGGFSLFECICECGKIFELNISDIKKDNIICEKCNEIKEKNKKEHEIKLPEVKLKIQDFKEFRKSLKKTNFLHLYLRYINNALIRNIEFNLTENEVKELTQKNCLYCGSIPYQIVYLRKYEPPYLYNGIDRIDSSKGYVLDNCVPCCGICNMSKSTMKIEDFIDYLKRIHAHVNSGGLDHIGNL